MNKKSLAIFIYSLAGGGAERVVSVLLNSLKESFDISLVLMNDTIAYDLPKGISILYLEKSSPLESGMKKFFKLPYLGLKYKKLCNQEQVDISLAFGNRPSYISIFAKLFGSRVRTVISERSTPSRIYADNSLLSTANKFLVRHLYPMSDGIIANSEGNRKDLIDSFLISSSKIERVYNPFDLQKIEQLSLEKADTDIMKGFVYIAAGRLDKGKNYRLLIEAFSQLKHVDSSLLIFGDGREKDTLMQLIKELKLEKRVHLLGFDRNPYKYFAKADVFVFGSNYEGFPNVLVEALACGLPIISTDCQSGPREILSPQSDPHTQLDTEIEEGEYGLLTPLGTNTVFSEAMTRMYKDTFLRIQYQKKAKIRARDFDSIRISCRFVEILQDRL